MRSVKQCLIVNGMPFEIKSIYGLESQKESKNNVIKGQSEDASNKECTICMSVDSNTIIMPCGHMCVCDDCGKSLKNSNHCMCPVCRGPIGSMVALNRWTQ